MLMILESILGRDYYGVGGDEVTECIYAEIVPSRKSSEKLELVI